MSLRLFVSSTSGNMKIKEQQAYARRILDGLGLEYTEIDVSDPKNAEAKAQMQEAAKSHSKSVVPPHVMREDSYIGDAQDFYNAVEDDNIEVFLRVPGAKQKKAEPLEKGGDDELDTEKSEKIEEQATKTDDKQHDEGSETADGDKEKKADGEEGEEKDKVSEEKGRESEEKSKESEEKNKESEEKSKESEEKSKESEEKNKESEEKDKESEEKDKESEEKDRESEEKDKESEEKDKEPGEKEVKAEREDDEEKEKKSESKADDD